MDATWSFPKSTKKNFTVQNFKSCSQKWNGTNLVENIIAAEISATHLNSKFIHILASCNSDIML